MTFPLDGDRRFRRGSLSPNYELSRLRRTCGRPPRAAFVFLVPRRQSPSPRRLASAFENDHGVICDSRQLRAGLALADEPAPEAALLAQVLAGEQAIALVPDSLEHST